LDTPRYVILGVFCYVSVVTLCWVNGVSTGTLWCPVVPIGIPMLPFGDQMVSNGVHMVHHGIHYWPQLEHHWSPQVTICPPQDTKEHHWATTGHLWSTKEHHCAAPHHSNYLDIFLPEGIVLLMYHAYEAMGWVRLEYGTVTVPYVLKRLTVIARLCPPDIMISL
jgi:hypothetical protein